MKKICKLALASIVLVISAAPVYATATINYELVTVTNPNNINDKTGFGAVDHVYQIGKYEVTIGQYTTFLNAIAHESDPYMLWNKSMMSANVQGINRTGSAGNYSYSVMQASTTGTSSESMPITGVSWFSAARFANWMANGQPAGVEDSTTTENGTYNLNGATSGTAVAKNTINPNTGAAPTFYIPSENEWYKAAYYNGAGTYYSFATQNNTLPGNNVNSTSSNQANYLDDAGNGYSVSQSPALSLTQTYLTNVGAFVNSTSHYGTFDQTGNVWEWNDLDGKSSKLRGLKGAAWTSTPPYLQSSYRLITVPASISVNVGMRLARTYP